MDDENYMKLAIEKAKESMEKGQSPFGACIVKAGEVVACEHNVVLESHDPTMHGEIHAIRVASKKLGTWDLSGCTIYSTAEPCPMCFSAIHWARISMIVYGASIGDAQEAGFNELAISNSTMKEEGKSGVEITSGVLVDKCKELFSQWKQHPKHRVY